MIPRDEKDKTNLVAVLAAAVDLARNGDDLVAVDVGLAAGTKTNIEPSSAAGAGALLDGGGTLGGGGGERGRGEGEQEGDGGEGRHV